MQRHRPTRPQWQQLLGRYWYLPIILLMALAGAGWWWLNRSPADSSLDPAQPADVPARVASTSGRPAEESARPTTASSTASRPAAAAENQLWVDIQGAVRRPGVYQLPAKSRLDHAVKAAGGLLPEADRRQVNLAQPLTDGAAIVIPRPGEQSAAAAPSAQPAAVAGSGSTAASQSSGAININSATQTELEQVSGIGPKRAGDIIAYRDTHGAFQSLDELGEISGIGEKILATLKAALTV